MGNAGKTRVADVFDWSRIIPAYEDLWNEQNLRRLSAGSSLADSKTRTFHPSRPDPFLMFEGFPTGKISLEGRVSIELSNWDIALERIKLKMGLIIPVIVTHFPYLNNLSNTEYSKTLFLMR